MPLRLPERLRVLVPSFVRSTFPTSPGRALERIYLQVHAGAAVLGAIIGFLWGGPAEWFTVLIWMLMVAIVAIVSRGAPVASLLVHSMLVLLLMDVYLDQPDAIVQRWQMGPLVPGVVAALSCFWLAVYGGWLGGLAGGLLAVSLLCGTLEERVAALWILGLMVSLGQAHGALHRRLRGAQRRLRREALTDPATGLGNRRALERDLPRLRAQAERQGQPLLLTLWDLDGLKVINDTWGHGAGDAVLTSFTEALQDSARTSDSLFRVGGDEFIGLHPGLADGALLVARVRQRFPLVSAGWVADDGTDLEALKDLADQRLYVDKADRRDRRQSRSGMAELVRSATGG